MPVSTIDLDYEPRVPPEGVDLAHTDGYVHLRERQAMAAAEVEQQILSRAEGAGVLGPVKGQGLLQPSRAGATIAGNGVDCLQVDEAAEVRLRDRLPYMQKRSHRGEVEEGARHGGHGEATVHDAVDVPRAVEPDAGQRSPLAWADDIDGIGQVGQ
jgi:hypothetical protein